MSCIRKGEGQVRWRSRLNGIAAKPDSLRSILRTHVREGEPIPEQKLPFDLSYKSWHAYVHPTHK